MFSKWSKRSTQRRKLIGAILSLLTTKMFWILLKRYSIYFVMSHITHVIVISPLCHTWLHLIVVLNKFGCYTKKLCCSPARRCREHVARTSPMQESCPPSPLLTSTLLSICRNLEELSLCLMKLGKIYYCCTVLLFPSICAFASTLVFMDDWYWHME